MVNKGNWMLEFESDKNEVVSQPQRLRQFDSEFMQYTHLKLVQDDWINNEN